MGCRMERLTISWRQVPAAKTYFGCRIMEWMCENTPESDDKTFNSVARHAVGASSCSLPLYCGHGMLL